MSFVGNLAILLIKLYQKVFSLETGLIQHLIPESKRKVCMYYPSCSNYSILAIKKYGVIKGLIKGGKRVISCRPGKEPKVDLP